MRVFWWIAGIVILGIGGLILFYSHLTFLPVTSAPIPLGILHVSPTPAMQSSVVTSSDGIMKMTLHTTKAQTTTTYTVTVSDQSGANLKQLFSTTLPQGSTLSIPANSWSTDNKYVFLLEKAADGPHVLVFKASGEQFANGQQFLDVVALFNAKITTHTFAEATGWASPTLLVINTADSANPGPSYWFEIPSLSFIQLANRFP